MKKTCLILALIPVLLLLTVVGLLLGPAGEVAEVATAPVSYRQLHVDDRKDVPPFAQNIYRAVYAHWQVGEWAWCFDIPPGSEEQLKQWVNAKGGRARDVAQCCELTELTPPAWWTRPADARLVSNRELEFTRMSMWFSPSQNRVWILYEQ